MNFLEVSKRQRQTKLQPALDTLLGGGSVLDVGVWCSMPEPHASENWLEKQYSGMGNLTWIGVEDMRAFKRMCPEVIPVPADGCALPFKNESIDLAVANAILEHVDTDDQESFVSEICRAVRKKAILAVPDRICPMEVYSRILILHWFPWWRFFLRAVGKAY
jgi:SAM-dependent methyltransferase